MRIGHSGVAPLRLPDTPRVRQLLRDLTAGLVQTDGAPPPTKAERDGIRAGVDFVMGEMAPEEREFSIIRSYMGFDDNGAGDRLEPWCRDGELGWVFDGTVHDIDFNTRLVGIDLTAIMGDARIMPPMALLLLWMASDVMDGRRVVLWAEEAPAYMPTPAFARAFKGIALRARKRNASFNAIAQQPSDMLTNEAGHALVKQARQMILFRNDKAVETDYREGLGLTPAEFRVITEDMFTVPWHSVLIKRQDGQSGLNRFDLSSLPQHLNILSGTPSRVRLLRQCLDHAHGDEMQAFAEFQSRIHETAA
jgi:type IV secretion system protein VirB4